MKKRILLSLPIGMSIRNILLSDVYTELIKKYEVLIITDPNYIAFCKTIAPYSEVCCYLPQGKYKKIIRSFVNKIDYFYFWTRYRPKTIEKYILKKKSDSKINFCLLIGIAALWRFIIEHQFGKRIIPFLFIEKEYCDFIFKNQINGLFVPSIDIPDDVVLSNCANHIGIPVNALVHSWDNLPSRGSILFFPDRLLVWNQLMHDQATFYHQIDPGRIRIVGIPQYDVYKFNTELIPRTAFFERKRIDEHKRIITYTCSAERVFPDEDAFILRLYSLVEEGFFGNCLLIIRLHPTERIEFYNTLLQGFSDVYLDKPDSLFAATHSNEQDSNGIGNFINILYHSDVLINLASTTTIDAAVFDTPIINIAYNYSLPESSWNSAKKWYESTHFNNILKTNGTTLVFSELELIEAINQYFNRPEYHQQGRRKIVEEQCYRVDGHSAERICNSIEEVIPS